MAISLDNARVFRATTAGCSGTHERHVPGCVTRLQTHLHLRHSNPTHTRRVRHRTRHHTRPNPHRLRTPRTTTHTPHERTRATHPLHSTHTLLPHNTTTPAPIADGAHTVARPHNKNAAQSSNNTSHPARGAPDASRDAALTSPAPASVRQVDASAPQRARQDKRPREEAPAIAPPANVQSPVASLPAAPAQPHCTHAASASRPPHALPKVVGSRRYRRYRRRKGARSQSTRSWHDA